MFKKVRTQFVMIGTTATLVVTLSLILAINLVSIYMNNARLTHALELMVAAQKAEGTHSESSLSKDPEHDPQKTSLEEPDFVLSRNADETTKSASEPSRQVESEFLEESAQKSEAGDEGKQEGQVPQAAGEEGASHESPQEGQGQDSHTPSSSGTGSGKSRHRDRSIPAQYKGHFFKVKGLGSGSYQIETTNEELLTNLDVNDLVEQILKRGNSQGFIEEFRYLVVEEKNNSYICFLDCSTELAARKTLWLISFIVGLAGILLSFIFIHHMSEWSIRPLKVSMEKQKQFITDAGHELKTPLSVIATDMDLLTMDYGENEWVESAKRQVRRLRKLVSNLISLSKMEEGTSLVLMNSSLSEMAVECADTYQTMARAQGRSLQSNIQDDLHAFIDPSSVQQLFSILCDNAVKYSLEESCIQIRLYSSGKRILFETENDWEHNIDPGELDRLFDRFYRGDHSRSKSNGKEGYGLGLSIAKACAEKNHAGLKVFQSQEGRLLFQVSFQRAPFRG